MGLYCGQTLRNGDEQFRILNQPERNIPRLTYSRDIVCIDDLVA